MKLFAHRGWCAGAGENTLAAFTRAAGQAGISGIELDVRRAPDGNTLLVCHDPPRAGGPTLELDAALEFLAGTALELYVELKEAGLAQRVIDKLVAAKMAERSVVFAFAPVAREFPWHGARPVRLGIIEVFPWKLNDVMGAYAPDVLFLGWDHRAWTRAAFRAWWSMFSLAQLSRRHKVPVVVGIVGRAADLDWLRRQGVDSAVTDLDEAITAALGTAARPETAPANR
ncbi:MAG: glycerophosphodiester phosphodiesterase [Hyphomicrobiales bacterium]|nr:glycerophosphodiester phosphodiesterase [Hyphomicrobiales bacterium]MBV8824553.1 glycerophosphodiester phosphodiesterase [Hyphomicrobiales bacterium]MBV9426875.1 glycerophosphodiester phosphodiesterase [Bradyrhizobiaceae bacterium]